MQRLVSIIIPTFNRAHLIGETLNSVLAQTHTNWECIIVDDGSTDYTCELMAFYCQRDPRIKYYHRPENKKKGANACRNYGFEMSKGQYINWFDSDDIMVPEKLEFQIRSLENSKLNYSVCETLVFKDAVENIMNYRFKKIISDFPFFEYLTMKIGWLTQAPLWKAEFLKNFGELFDEDLQAAQEWEFHLRVLHKEERYAVCTKPLVYIRKHKESISYNANNPARSFHYFYARLKVYRKLKSEMNEDSVQFLRTYLINSFKKMIWERNGHSIKAFRLFLLPEKEVSLFSKLNALLAIAAYLSFKRGNYMLQQISYK